MKIRTRVKIAGAVALCVILAYGTWSVYSHAVMVRRIRQVRQAEGIVSRISMLRALTYDYLSLPTPQAQREWSALYRELLQLLEEPAYRKIRRRYGVKGTVAKLKEVGAAFDKIKALKADPAPQTPVGETVGPRERRLTTQLLLASQDLMTRIFKLNETINEHLTAAQRLEASLDLLALLILGFIIAGAGVFIQRSVVKPVLRLHAGVEKVGAGRLDYQVGMPGGDEIGELSRAFDQMTANLRQVTVSRDELAVEIEERRRVEEALQQSNKRLDLLAETARQLLANTAPQTIVESLCQKVMAFLDCDAFFNFLAEKDSGRLRLNAYAGIPAAEARRLEWLDYGEAVCGCAARDGCRIVAEDIQHRDDPRTRLVKSYGIQVYACHPLMVENLVLGTLSFGSRRKTSFAPDELDLMKAVADQVAIAMNRLRIAEKVRHLASFPELNPSPVLEIDLSGAVTYHNQAAAETLKKLGLEGQWRRLLPDDIDDIIAAAETRQEKFFRRELKVQDILLSQNIFFAEPFKVLRIYSMDITRRKEAEEKLQWTLADLARSNKELEEFAYVASHDLQEPLRKMANFSEMLTQRYQGQLDERGEKYLGYITDGSRRMKVLINDLLAFSRVGRADFRLMPTDMNDILRGTLKDIQTLIREEKAKITHDPLPTLEINPISMAQLLQNLITNAIKFHGDRPPRVHLSARPEGREWVFAVRDQGIGFDSRHAERIFKVFQRLHTKEEYPGTGIGLAICRKIVERHGGRIWAEAEPGKGATFYFTIPV